MSPKDEKDVPKLVEKYRSELPNLNRKVLARLIRAEKNIENNSADGKKLNRYLKKSFEIEKRLREALVEAHQLKDELLTKMKKIEEFSHKLKFADTYLEVIRLLETDEDFEKLRKFFEEIRNDKYEKRRAEDCEDEQEFIAQVMEENEGKT